MENTLDFQTLFPKGMSSMWRATMFIHTLHVRARLRDPGPEELEVSLVPRRIRGKRPAEEPAVVISQTQVTDFEVEDPV